jgi:hypothetical protein
MHHHPVLHLVVRTLAIEVLLHARHHRGSIVSVHEPGPVVETVRDLVILVPEGRLQQRVDVNLVRVEVPVPNATAPAAVASAYRSWLRRRRDRSTIRDAIIRL